MEYFTTHKTLESALALIQQLINETLLNIEEILIKRGYVGTLPSWEVWIKKKN